MTVIQLKTVLEDIEEKLYSKSVTHDLCRANVTDYERGLVAGKIELLNMIKKKIQDENKTSNKR